MRKQMSNKERAHKTNQGEPGGETPAFTPFAQTNGHSNSYNESFTKGHARTSSLAASPLGAALAASSGTLSLVDSLNLQPAVPAAATPSLGRARTKFDYLIVGAGFAGSV